MDIEKIKQVGELVLAIGGGLVVLASAIVTVTPSKDDDNWFANLLEKPIIGSVLKYFIAHSIVEKKADGKIELSNAPAK